MEKIITIAAVCLAAALWGYELYLHTKGDLLEIVAQLIAEAEKLQVAGHIKMDGVVSQLLILVPTPLKAILTETKLRGMAQKVFGAMKAYAEVRHE